MWGDKYTLKYIQNDIHSEDPKHVLQTYLGTYILAYINLLPNLNQ